MSTLLLYNGLNFTILPGILIVNFSTFCSLSRKEKEGEKSAIFFQISRKGKGETSPIVVN